MRIPPESAERMHAQARGEIRNNRVARIQRRELPSRQVPDSHSDRLVAIMVVMLFLYAIGGAYLIFR